MKPQPHNQLSLYSPRGERLYLDEAERQRFLQALEQADERTRLLGLVLFYTGCRLSEALELTPEHIRQVEGVIVFRTLKRRKLVMREVPVPEWLITQLTAQTNNAHLRLFPCHRATAWRQIKGLMTTANILGRHASPKGLRHSFAVHAIRSGVPMNLVQKWLGHSALSTTSIYANIVGDNERSVAAWAW